MTFFEYYKSLPNIKQKRAFRKQIIEACKIEPGTFYTWINRGRISYLAQTIIAEILQMEQTELFPEIEISINHLKN